jgi:purine-nucleoside/S-methyl-5'-thioadenosine phosphorylase / adenosine deaminase
MLPELATPFRWEGDHIAAEVNGARALFTTRRGGVSGGPFDSLNLGIKTADERANVEENRARVAAAAGCGWERFQFGWQVHGGTVRRATETRSQVTQEDGQATALSGHPALVFGADCQPVLLVTGGAVAALHCGWRTMAAGVIPEGVAALRDVGGDGPVTALIGPGARACCYEVGEEVHEVFAGYDARRGERNIDLAAIAAAQLAEAGVAEVHDSGLCTMCWFGLFFSHRRDGGVTGRQAGLVWRV